jgi:hypothetical protein
MSEETPQLAIGRKRGRPKNLAAEIERRTKDSVKLVKLEARKIAIGQMAIERLDEIIALLRGAGFRIDKSAVQSSLAVQAAPIAPTVIQPPAPLINNPCKLCGQEGAFAEDMPDGTKRILCSVHGRQRAKEKAEENETKSLMGNEGTMFARPRNQNAPPAPKMVIQHSDDLLKGQFANGTAEVIEE